MNTRALILAAVAATSLFGQTSEQPAGGVNLMETKTYSAQENGELIRLYEGLRVTDVSDGMDMVGLPNTGLVSHEIHAAWVDTENMSHVMRGIAATARLVPTQQPDRPKPGEDFEAWRPKFNSPDDRKAFEGIIKPGIILVLDDVEDKDIGTIGSRNILAWVKLGAVGVITDAGARDTDEIALQKVPLYIRKKGRGIRPGRNELESVNRPVSIGGVLVCPGDVVVADGDGIVVVPRAVARPVAHYAKELMQKDKAARRNLYERLGKPLDKTVR